MTCVGASYMATFIQYAILAIQLAVAIRHSEGKMEKILMPTAIMMLALLILHYGLLRVFGGMCA